MRNSLTLLLSFVVFLFFLTKHPSLGLRVDKTFVVTNFVKTFETFGFGKGGRINISATSQPVTDNALILICTVKDFSIILNDLDDSCEIQQLSKVSDCWRVKIDGNVSILVISLQDLYTFSVFNCQNNTHPTLTVHVIYELVNPEDGQLPYGWGQVPMAYVFFACLWSANLFLWFINGLRFRQFFTRVHVLLSLVMFFKFSRTSHKTSHKLSKSHTITSFSNKKLNSLY
jgi:hypothetical protein